MSFVEILKAIVMGVVEGFTEWIPISSTGHMILIDEIIHLDVTPEFRELFLVVIQIGAALAIVVPYFSKLNPFDPRKKRAQKKATWQLWAKIVIACIPSVILGFLFDDWVGEHLYNGLVVAIMLIVYGVLFIVVENLNRNKEPSIARLGQISYSTAFYIGLFQALALVPGTSRSGATILGAMILGCARPIGAEFSFFVGLPIIAGASFLRIIKYEGAFGAPEIWLLAVGSVTAFLVSVYSIRFFIGWIRKNDFKLFGYYRIVLGVIVLIWFGISSLMAA